MSLFISKYLMMFISEYIKHLDDLYSDESHRADLITIV